MSSFNPKEYWENRLKDKWGLNGVGSLGLGRYYNEWLYRVRRRIFFSHVRPLFNDWSRIDVLDIGSGTGYYVDLWKSLGVHSVTATDITTIATRKLQEKFPDIECYQLDIGGDLPVRFVNKQYRVISVFDVLFHIVDDDCYQRAVKNISRMLRTGGFFVFSEHPIHGETFRAQHEVIRSLNEIEVLLEKTGFKVKTRIPIFAIMNYPVDSKSNIPKAIWRRMTLIVRKLPILGFALGALLYPFELILTSCLKEGPSTELMICEKYE